MKILLFHPDIAFRRRLALWLARRANHAVLFEGDAPQDLVRQIACHEPDLVVLPPEEPCQKANAELQRALLAFPDCLFTTFPENAQRLYWKGGPPEEVRLLVAHAETLYREFRVSPHRRPAVSRIQFGDSEREALEAFGRAGAAPTGQRTEAVRRRQEAQFLLQLGTAITADRHARAKEYLKIARRFERGLRMEMACGVACGSIQVVRLRDQIARWLTVLAHYIGSAEIEHCPASQSASPYVTFAHRQPSDIQLYAAHCVLGYGCNPRLYASLMETAAWAFDARDEAEITAAGLRLMGVCSYLSEVAQAQVRAMDQFLDSQSPFHQRRGGLSWELRRTFAVFFEFWGWNCLWSREHRIRLLTEGFHAGAMSGNAPRRAAPSFLKFSGTLHREHPCPPQTEGRASDIAGFRCDSGDKRGHRTPVRGFKKRRLKQPTS